MSKKKKVWRIITDVLAVLGVLFIVYMSVMIYQERKKLIKIDPNLEESYTGEYPRYINEVNEDDIPDEEYYPTMEEALQKADVYYDEYEPYQKNIDNLLVDMENDQYRFIYYQSIQKKKSMNTFATFKIREVNGEKRYAFLRSYVRDSEKFYKGIGDADKNTKAQLARSDYMQHYGIDKDARFVFGDIMEEELKKGESAEALTVEGQKPDAVIPYEENGKKWYFWYFTDLQSDKEGNKLEYTLKK